MLGAPKMERRGPADRRPAVSRAARPCRDSGLCADADEGGVARLGSAIRAALRRRRVHRQRRRAAADAISCVRPRVSSAVADAGRPRVTPADIAAAWRRDPAAAAPRGLATRPTAANDRIGPHLRRIGKTATCRSSRRRLAWPQSATTPVSVEFRQPRRSGRVWLADDQRRPSTMLRTSQAMPAAHVAVPPSQPGSLSWRRRWSSCSIPRSDPFARTLQEEERVVERYVMRRRTTSAATEP